jgi:hypothetical protein
MSEEVEHLDGREVVRDPVTGQFQKVKLDPKTASDMQAARRYGAASSERLLQEQGYNQTDNKAPEYITVMATQALKFPAAMSHWRRVHSLSDTTSETGGLERPGQNERCQLCGQYNFHSNDGRLWSRLSRILKEYNAAAEAEGADAG